MLKAIFNWFTGRPLPGTEAPPVQPEAVPYKIETPPQPVRAHQPEPARCGCGRSQSGFCVGLHSLTPEQWAVHADNPKAAKSTAKKRTPAAKKEAVAKPAAQPRKPKRAPAAK
jgi:hypothetical protein